MLGNELIIDRINLIWWWWWWWQNVLTKWWLWQTEVFLKIGSEQRVDLRILLKGQIVNGGNLTWASETIFRLLAFVYLKEQKTEKTVWEHR